MTFFVSFFAVPPTIRADPPDGNYVVKKGRKVELKCVASGNPDPTITWTRQVSHTYTLPRLSEISEKNWST